MNDVNLNDYIIPYDDPNTQVNLNMIKKANEIQQEQVDIFIEKNLSRIFDVKA